jgi:hypothetical protein
LETGNHQKKKWQLQAEEDSSLMMTMERHHHRN